MLRLRLGDLALQGELVFPLIVLLRLQLLSRTERRLLLEALLRLSCVRGRAANEHRHQSHS